MDIAAPQYKILELDGARRMMLSFRSRNIPGLSPPPVLIFFHIPKTGGAAMTAILRHCFTDRFFNIGFWSENGEDADTVLWVRSTARIAEYFHQMPPVRQRQVRCLAGDHITYDIDTIFDRPSKFFTILRDPVDRVISEFFFSPWRMRKGTLEQHLEMGGIDPNLDNQQVRMLSGCPELDAPWNPEGRTISTPPVERLHLEMAKHNIEERFIVAAPLERFTELAWFLKRLYGWPLHRVLFLMHNKNANRPKLEEVSEVTRKRLETLNQYDVELYEWVKARFAKQIEPLEPSFSHEVRRFELLNGLIQRLAKYSPKPIYPVARDLMFRFTRVPPK